MFAAVALTHDLTAPHDDDRVRDRECLVGEHLIYGGVEFVLVRQLTPRPFEGRPGDARGLRREARL